MATKIYTGRAAIVAQVDTITVGGTPSAGNTYSVTINSRSVTYTAVSGDTTTTIATALLALLQTTSNPEFREINWSSSAAVITGTANTPGLSFTASVSTSGGTITRAGLVANSSPSDVSLAGNWSGGTLPATGDDLVFEDSSIPAIYGLSTTFDPASITIRDSFSGPIGLPKYNTDGGYLEYRGCVFQITENATITIDQSPSAGAGHYKFSATSDVVTLNLNGPGGGLLGQESVQITGTASNSVLNCYGGSVLVAPDAGDTATLTTVRVVDGVVRCTSGVTLSSATIYQTGGTVQIETNVSVWNIDGNATGIVRGAATIGTVSIDAGTLQVRSTGTITTLNVGSGATVDFSGSRSPITVTNCTIAAGAAINDPDRRVTWTNGIKLNRCTLAEVQLSLGVHFTVTPSSY